jgi:predicted ATP-grasp superfamily ATP-dependent carboligase
MIRGMARLPRPMIHEHVSGGGIDSRAIPASWLAEGSAMRRALARDFAEAGASVAITLDRRLPDEPGPWLVHRIEPGEADEVVPRLAAQADHTILIAPETWGVLGALTAAVFHAGGRPLGSTPVAIYWAADKLLCGIQLEMQGIPAITGRRVHPHDGLPPSTPYPAVLKPIDGAGCVDTLYVEGPRDPIVRTFAGPVALLQPFVPGEARSASFLVPPKGPPVLIGVGLQDVSVADGRFAYRGGTVLTDDLPADHPARRALAAVPGLAGLVGVDYLHDRSTGRAVVVEINPRPTTSIVGLVAALGAGRLAARWLSEAGRPSLPLPARAVSFRADGTIRGRDS